MDIERASNLFTTLAGPFVGRFGGQVKPTNFSGNPFLGKSPSEIDGMFRAKGFDPRGLDPINGKGGYVNPKSGRSYHIDPGKTYKKGTEYPHVDVNRPKSSNLGKKKFPLGDKLNDNE